MTKKEQLEKLLSLGLPDDVLKEMILELSDEHQKEQEKKTKEEKKKQKEQEKLKKMIPSKQKQYDGFIKEKEGILSRIKDIKGIDYIYTEEELGKMEVKDLVEIYDMYLKSMPERLQIAREEYYASKKQEVIEKNDELIEKEDEIQIEESKDEENLEENQEVIEKEEASRESDEKEDEIKIEKSKDEENLEEEQEVIEKEEISRESDDKEKQDEKPNKETKIISNDPKKMKEKIKTVEENLDAKLKVVNEPPTKYFKLKKGPATFDEFVKQGGTEKEPGGLLRRVVKSIKNKIDEWRKTDTINEEDIISILNEKPTDVSDNNEVLTPQEKQAPVIEPVNPETNKSQSIEDDEILKILSEGSNNQVPNAEEAPVIEPIKPEPKKEQSITDDEILKILSEGSNTQIQQVEAETVYTPQYGDFKEMSFDDIHGPLKNKY